MLDNQIKAKGVAVWMICALFFLYEFLLRTVIGTFQHPVMEDLNLSSFEFSLLSTTIFFLVYGIMQIPAGLIIDLIGLKRSLIIGSICCAFAATGFAYSYTYPIAVGYRFFMGFGASFGFLCLLISVREWMPHKYSAIFIGLSQFIGTLGPMLAAGPLEALAESKGVSWRLVFLSLGAAGFILLALVIFFVENNREKAGEYTIVRKPESALFSVKRLFTRSQPWFIAVLSATIYFSVEYLSENEGRAFLKLKGISASSASYMITVSWIGYAIGCPLLGFFSDLLERRKIIITFCAFVGVMAILGLLYLPGKITLFVSFFGLGIAASGQSIGFACMAEQFKKRFVAVGFGLNNTFLTVLSAINAPLMGALLDYVQKGPSNSLEEYLFVFQVLIGIAIVALLISVIFLKETYCKSVVDFTILRVKGVFK